MGHIGECPVQEYRSYQVPGAKEPVDLGWLLEGLQEQLVVGLNELHVGLLGYSHRRGGRLVQPVGFSSRTKTHRVAST